MIDFQLEPREAVKKVVIARNITNRDLAKMVGMSEQSLSKMLNGTISLTDRSLAKISQVLNIPFEVLRYGENVENFLLEGPTGAKENAIEEKSKKKSPVSKSNSLTLYDVSQEGIPFYNVDVFAGDVESFTDGPELPDSYLILPGVKDCQFSCRVSGDSMYNKIKPGAIIACREIFDKSIIAFGEVHLVITPEQKLVKYVRKHPTDKTRVILRSHNPEHDDIEVPIDKIIRLYLVKVIVNQEQM